MGDLLVVALLGLLLRLLAAPVQPPPDHLADVLGVVVDAEVAADHLGDPVGAPQVVVPAVGLGPLQEQPLQLLDLLVGEPGLGAGVGLGGQLLGGVPVELHPGVDGGASAAEEVGDRRRGDSPCLTSSTARRRRRSSSSAVPMGLIPCSTIGTLGLFSWPSLSQ